MTVDNSKLVAYLALELEVCYVAPEGRCFWVAIDRVHKRDSIALEMLRLFNRFTRIGKSFVQRAPAPPKRGSVRRLPDGAGVVGNMSSDDPSKASPYARCIAVRIRVKDMHAGMAIRPGVDPQLVLVAPVIDAKGYLDPNLPVTASDPIVQMLARTKSDDSGSTPFGMIGPTPYAKNKPGRAKR